MKIYFKTILAILSALLIFHQPLLSQSHSFCGADYNPKYNNSSNSRFNLEGSSWDCRFVSYYFINGTFDIAGDGERDAVKRAFDSWSAITNLDFYEACSANDADIKIKWATGSHGNHRNGPGVNCTACKAFDGPGGIIAHAAFPDFVYYGNDQGDIHFDDAEDWTIGGGGLTRDVETIALHEIGHSIGLLHVSPSSNAVMKPGDTIPVIRRILTTDDISGARAIYDFRHKLFTGSNLLCNQQTKVYTLTDNCNTSDFTITWSVTGSLQIVSGQGSTSVSIKGTSSAPSTGTITLTLDFACEDDDLVETMSVNVGKPGTTASTPIFINTPSFNQACIEATSTMTTGPGIAPGQSFTWDFGAWGSYVTGYAGAGNKSPNFYLDYSAPTSATVKVSISNSCGSGTQNSGLFSTIDCYSSYRISPNPVTNHVQITADDKKGLLMKRAKKSKIYGVEVVDQNSRKQISKKYKAGLTDTNLDLSQLVPGIYTVSIFDGKRWYPYQVVKE